MFEELLQIFCLVAVGKYIVLLVFFNSILMLIKYLLFFTEGKKIYRWTIFQKNLMPVSSLEVTVNAQNSTAEIVCCSHVSYYHEQ